MLAVFTSSSTSAVFGNCVPKAAPATFREFRALSRLQPASVAARLVRLAGGVERAIKQGHPERFARARWLEEAVGYVAQSRPNHAESQALQQCLTKLLRQSFQSLDWRRPLIAGLKPARTLVSAKKRVARTAAS